MCDDTGRAYYESDHLYPGKETDPEIILFILFALLLYNCVIEKKIIRTI